MRFLFSIESLNYPHIDFLLAQIEAIIPHSMEFFQANPSGVCYLPVIFLAISLTSWSFLHRLQVYLVRWFLGLEQCPIEFKLYSQLVFPVVISYFKHLVPVILMSFCFTRLQAIWIQGLVVLLVLFRRDLALGSGFRSILLPSRYYHPPWKVPNFS